MWIKIEDTRGLASTLRRLSTDVTTNNEDTPNEDLHSTPSSDFFEKSEWGTGKNKHSKKSKLAKLETPLLRKIAGGFLILCLCALIALISVNAYNAEEIKLLNSITDTRLVLYENQIHSVKCIANLFAIYDDTSYQRARDTVIMSDDMLDYYFPTKTSKGSATGEITATIDDIRYEITEDEAVDYLVYLTRRLPEGSKQYLVRATYVGNTLVGLQILN